MPAMTMKFKQLGIQTDVGIWDDAQGTKARLYALSQKAKRLKGRGKRLPKGFQLDAFDPENIGMSEEASDAFSPEELVELFAHPAKTVDWDKLDSINYFWEGE